MTRTDILLSWNNVSHMLSACLHGPGHTQDENHAEVERCGVTTAEQVTANIYRTKKNRFRGGSFGGDLFYLRYKKK